MFSFFRKSWICCDDVLFNPSNFVVSIKKCWTPLKKQKCLIYKVKIEWFLVDIDYHEVVFVNGNDGSILLQVEFVWYLSIKISNNWVHSCTKFNNWSNYLLIHQLLFLFSFTFFNFYFFPITALIFTSDYFCFFSSLLQLSTQNLLSKTV